MTTYKKVHYVLLYIRTWFSHLIQFLMYFSKFHFTLMILDPKILLTKKNMSGLHNTSWHNLPRQIFPYCLLNLLFYRYVTIKDMMYFTVNILYTCLGKRELFVTFHNTSCTWYKLKYTTVITLWLKPQDIRCYKIVWV
jgi:hypothetical protein